MHAALMRRGAHCVVCYAMGGCTRQPHYAARCVCGTVAIAAVVRDTPVQTRCSPAPQAVPQAPQWFGSLSVLTQTPLHSVKPTSQLDSQLPATQATEPLSGVAQALPHAPQWAKSVFSATQLSPHASNPLLQACPQVPAVQIAALLAGPAQAVPHSPQ